MAARLQAGLLAWAVTGMAAAAELDRLAWLSGDWAGCLGRTVVEEHWGLPAAGIMLGTARNRRGPTLTAFEFLRIEAREDGLTYVPMPNAQSTVTFALHRLEDAAVEFRNPQHDFPQFIAYRLAEGGMEVYVGRLDESRGKALSYKLERGAAPDCAAP